jgi:hypothetical protein
MRKQIGLFFLVGFLLSIPLHAAPPAEWVAKTVAYAKCVGTGGNSNVSTSGAGTDFAHNLSCTLDASMVKANGIINTCALLTVTTPASAPQLQFKLKACTVPGCGSGTVTTLVAQGAFSPVQSVTTNGWVCFKTVARAAPGAAVSTDSSFITYPSAVTWPPDSNTVAQPVALNTSVAQSVTLTSQWLTNQGTGSTAALNALIVSVTN